MERQAAVPEGLGVPALLLVLTLAAYLPALRAGFVWDDPQYVTSNPTLRSLEGLRQIWLQPGAVPQYYPLVHTTFWLEYHLWGSWAAGYHLVNVVLHALNATLAWTLLRRLGVPGAALAAVVFALHPVHVESVAWVTERKNVLSGAFYLGSLLAYARHLGLAGEARSPRRDQWLAFALFLLALFSKTVTASLPVAVLILCWWKRRRLRPAELRDLVPFFLAGTLLGLTTAWIEKYRVGASGPEWSLSATDRIAIAGRALWFYLGKLAWPRHLSFIYPRWSIDAKAWSPYAYPLAALLVLAALWRLRGRIERGPLAAALFFGVSLSPALGFLDVYPMRFSFVADHFQYLASVGPIALFAAALALCTGRLGSHGHHARIGLAVLLTIVLGGLTFARARIFHDQETLWRDALAQNPGCWLCGNNLGAYLLSVGRTPEAAPALAAAVRLKPDYVEARVNLGLALARQGETGAALEQYAAALAVDPMHVAAHYNLGRLLAARSRLPEATPHLQQAARLNPGNALVQQDLGRALALQGRLQEAAGPLFLGLAAKPDDAEAHRELADVLIELGRLDEAQAQYAQALRIDPGSLGARFGLARSWAARGNVDRAIAELSGVVRTQPDFAEARLLLEKLRAAQARPSEAAVPDRSSPHVNERGR